MTIVYRNNSSFHLSKADPKCNSEGVRSSHYIVSILYCFLSSALIIQRFHNEEHKIPPELKWYSFIFLFSFAPLQQSVSKSMVQMAMDLGRYTFVGAFNTFAVREINHQNFLPHQIPTSSNQGRLRLLEAPEQNIQVVFHMMGHATHVTPALCSPLQDLYTQHRDCVLKVSMSGKVIQVVEFFPLHAYIIYIHVYISSK